MRWLAIVCFLVACTTPTRKAAPKRRRLDISADRTHPSIVELEYVKAGIRGKHVSARAPAAGTYWFDVPTLGSSSVLSKTRFVVWFDDTEVLLELVDESGQTTHRGKPFRGGADVETSETADPPTVWHVRLVVKAPTNIGFDASEETRPKPQVALVWPACDYHAIDPANPRCADVQPACIPNAPDWTNGHCCFMRGCEFGRLNCHAKIVREIQEDMFEVDVGADRELMTDAEGTVRIREHNVFLPGLLVLSVQDKTSTVLIPHASAGNVKQLIELGQVTFAMPDAYRHPD